MCPGSRGSRYHASGRNNCASRINCAFDHAQVRPDHARREGCTWRLILMVLFARGRRAWSGLTCAWSSRVVHRGKTRGVPGALLFLPLVLRCCCWAVQTRPVPFRSGGPPTAARRRDESESERPAFSGPGRIPVVVVKPFGGWMHASSIRAKLVRGSGSDQPPLAEATILDAGRLSSGQIYLPVTIIGGYFAVGNVQITT